MTSTVTPGYGYGLTIIPDDPANVSTCQPTQITWTWSIDSTTAAVSQQVKEASLSLYIVDSQSLDAASSSTTTTRRRRRRGMSRRHDKVVAAARQVAGMSGSGSGSEAAAAAAVADSSSSSSSSATSSSAVQILLNGRTSVFLQEYSWQDVNVAPGSYVALLAINGAGSAGIARSPVFTVVNSGDLSCVQYGLVGGATNTTSTSSSVLLPLSSSVPVSTTSISTAPADTPTSSASAPSNASDASQSTTTSHHSSHGGGVAAAVIIPLLACIAFVAFLWHRKRRQAAIPAAGATALRDGSNTPTEMTQRDNWATFSGPDLDGAKPLDTVAINEPAPAYAPADVQDDSPWLSVDPLEPPTTLFNYHRNTHLSRISEVPSTMTANTANTADIDLGYGRSDADDDHLENLKGGSTAPQGGAGLQRSDSGSSSIFGGVRRKPVPALRTISNTDDAYGDDVLATLAEDVATLPVPTTSSRPDSDISSLRLGSQRSSARASSNLGDFEAPLPPTDAMPHKSTWSVSTMGAHSSVGHDSILSSTTSQRDAEMSLAYNEALERLAKEQQGAQAEARPPSVASSSSKASSVHTVRGRQTPIDERSPFEDDAAPPATPPKRDSRERVLLPAGGPAPTVAEQRAPTLSLHLGNDADDSFKVDF